MSDDERQIRIIIDYASEYLPEPQVSWPKKEFLRVSYARWAVNYILKMLGKNPEWTPMQTIEEFKNLVSPYMYLHPNDPDIDYNFRVGYEVASDLSDIIMAMLP